MGFNRFGYAVVGSTTVALALLLVGGPEYAASAGALLAVAVFCLAWAMRRTASGRDRRSQTAQGDGDDDERDRRERMVEAEKTRSGGEL